MGFEKYAKIRKKKKSRWIIFLQVITALIFASVIFFILYYVHKNQIFSAIIQILTADIKFLMLLLGNIFVICSVCMILLYQWVDRENIRFRNLRNRYRSLLISPDYYRSIRRVNIDQFVAGTITTGPQGRLEVEHDLKKSSLVTIDDAFIHKDAKQTYISYKDGRLDGVFKTYFTNGNLLAEISYKDGRLDGRSVVYYPNGLLHNEKYFKEGRLHGVFRAWDEEGALFFEIEYANDIQHGYDKTYRKNGIIEYEDTYIDGVLVRRKTFDEMGQFKYLQKYRKAA